MKLDLSRAFNDFSGSTGPLRRWLVHAMTVYMGAMSVAVLILIVFDPPVDRARLQTTDVRAWGMADEETKSEFELEYFEVTGETEALNGWYWKVTATGNGERISQADEPFDSESNAERNFKLNQRAFLSL